MLEFTGKIAYTEKAEIERQVSFSLNAFFVSVFVGTENFFSHDIKNALRENKETVKISIAILLHL